MCCAFSAGSPPPLLPGEAELVEAALSRCERRFRLKDGRVFGPGGANFDLILAGDKAPVAEAKVLAEVTYSKRPHEADHAGRQKLKKYFEAREHFGACRRVGLVAVGERRLWISLFDAWCSEPAEMDAVFWESVELRKREKPSGWQNRLTGVSTWEAHDAWNAANKTKLRDYERESRARKGAKVQKIVVKK